MRRGAGLHRGERVPWMGWVGVQWLCVCCVWGWERSVVKWDVRVRQSVVR